jgi:hypothetical protein
MPTWVGTYADKFAATGWNLCRQICSTATASPGTLTDPGKTFLLGEVYHSRSMLAQ